MAGKDKFCLDAYAIFSYLQNEKGAAKIADLLKKAEKKKIEILMHEINLGEVYYTLYREEGEFFADEIYGQLRDYPVSFIADIPEQYLLMVCRLKGTYRISYADAFAIGLAKDNNAKLVTGDYEIKPVEEDKIINVLWI